MALNIDVSDDFESLCSDFNTTVTLRIAGVDTQLSSVLNEPVDWRELDPTGGQVIRSGVLFVWSKKRSVQPPIGSIIVDSEENYWTIWKMANKQHVECYEAKCLNLNIITAAANIATILKATYTHGDAGEANSTWVGLWSGEAGGTTEDQVVAHFQPMEEESRIAFGGEWPAESYKVYLQDPIPTELSGGEFRLVDSEGGRYRVLKYIQEGRIDKFPVCLAERITAGSEYVP